jgi:UDP-N-acetyl-2-amino-2-deoxyglucuronate dehydrogenase
MLTKRPVQFALVGCGAIAVKHAEAISSGTEDGEVVAVCDCDPARAREMGERLGVATYTSLEQMSADCRTPIDVISILTPSGLHASGVHEALRCGFRDILVEKPMALAYDDAVSITTACEAVGARLFVVKQNRYNLPIQALHRAIESGRFGRIVSGSVRLRWCRKQAYYDASPWRGTWEMDGGVFANQAIHFIDLLLWLLGDARSVFAYTARQLASIEAEDTGVVAMRFESGALGSIEATTATRPRDLEASISVLGEHGAAEIGGFAANKLEQWDFEVATADDVLVRQYGGQNPSQAGYAHVCYLQDVIRSIQFGLPPVVGAREGLRSLRLLHAIYESVETNRQINLRRFVPRHTKLGRRALRLDESHFVSRETEAIIDGSPMATVQQATVVIDDDSAELKPVPRRPR